MKKSKLEGNGSLDAATAAEGNETEMLDSAENSHSSEVIATAATVAVVGVGAGNGGMLARGQSWDGLREGVVHEELHVPTQRFGGIGRAHDEAD